ncbi:hypothetical protein J437_LFUL001734 [Ladona fulva]|uniref:Uncharacterized protein n=1 Tax=Ladona fulva TaxID=123851 RepID=A0A8K0K0M2_LADFU|nr:hypothetical protein J437_LFUL001734 [Ladona fulva]
MLKIRWHMLIRQPAILLLTAEGREGNIERRYGLGNRYGKRENLVELCKKYLMVEANIIPQNHQERRYYWKMSGDRICQMHYLSF